MAKVNFSKLGLKSRNLVKTINFNDQVIEVKQYLPIEDKLQLITNVIELSHDTNNYSNPAKVKVYTTLQVIEYYTNITFTEKQKETPTKLYDLMDENGLARVIFDAIDRSEIEELIEFIETTIDSIYKYRNSVLGILDTISQDYSNLNFDIEKLQKDISNPENAKFLKSVIDKMY